MIRPGRISSQMINLLILITFSFVVFLLSPSEHQAEVVVSSFRYSYSAFILMILLTFIVAKRYHKLEVLSILSIASMIMVTSFLYYPKLVFIYGPLSLLAVFLLDKYQRTLEGIFS